MNNDALQLTHFPVDDLPLLVALLRQLDLPGLYDREIKDHGLHTGLSGGWLLTVWLVFILTEGDHTKYKVQDWVARHAALLSQLCERPIHDQECNDHRLSRVLARLAVVGRWEPLEAALWQHSLTVYQLGPPRVGGRLSAHCDATTVSGYHQVQEDGVMQRGVRKAQRPDLAQLKLMTVAVHPHGQWVGTQVVPTQRADDGLSLPLITRVREVLGQTGVLYVGADGGPGHARAVAAGRPRCRWSPVCNTIGRTGAAHDSIIACRVPPSGSRRSMSGATSRFVA
jgi:transposase